MASIRVYACAVALLAGCGRVGFDAVARGADAATCAAPSYPQAVLADAPLGYWRLQDATAIAADASGHGRDGTYKGAYTQQIAGPLPAIADVAVAFDGTTGNIHVPWNLLAGNAARTLELWLATSSSADANPLSWGARAPGQLSQIAFWKSALGFTGCCDMYDWTVPVATVNTADNAWHHVVVTYDGVMMYVYIDGVQFAPTVDQNGPPLLTGTSDLVIGSEFDDIVYYSGALAEVAVYEIALTPAQVEAHYAARASPGC